MVSYWTIYIYIKKAKMMIYYRRAHTYTPDDPGMGK